MTREVQKIPGHGSEVAYSYMDDNTERKCEE